MKQQKERGSLGVTIVVLAGLVIAAVSLIWRIKNQQSPVLFASVGVFYIFLLYYCFKGYQKPHGNMIQILMLILAVYVASTTVVADNRWGSFTSWITLLASNLAAVFMGFMAGRLNKLEENKYTATLVSVLLFVRCLWFLENMNMSGASVLLFILDRCLALLMWIGLVLIYSFRYKAHREAGE